MIVVVVMMTEMVDMRVDTVEKDRQLAVVGMSISLIVAAVIRFELVT